MGQVTLHLCASVSSSVMQEKAVASSSEGLVQPMSEALTTLPTPPPSLQKQTPKGLVSEATGNFRAALAERHFRQYWNSQERRPPHPPGPQPSQNTAQGLRGLPPLSHLSLPSPFLTPRPHMSLRIDRTDCREPAVPHTRGTHKTDVKNAHPGEWP